MLVFFVFACSSDDPVNSFLINLCFLGYHRCQNDVNLACATRRKSCDNLAINRQGPLRLLETGCEYWCGIIHTVGKNKHALIGIVGMIRKGRFLERDDFSLVPFIQVARAFRTRGCML